MSSDFSNSLLKTSSKHKHQQSLQYINQQINSKKDVYLSSEQKSNLQKNQQALEQLKLMSNFNASDQKHFDEDLINNPIAEATKMQSDNYFQKGYEKLQQNLKNRQNFTADGKRKVSYQLQFQKSPEYEVDTQFNLLKQKIPFADMEVQDLEEENFKRDIEMEKQAIDKLDIWKMNKISSNDNYNTYQINIDQSNKQTILCTFKQQLKNQQTNSYSQSKDIQEPNINQLAVNNIFRSQNFGNKTHKRRNQTLTDLKQFSNSNLNHAETGNRTSQNSIMNDYQFQKQSTLEQQEDSDFDKNSSFQQTETDDVEQFLKQSDMKLSQLSSMDVIKFNINKQILKKLAYGKMTKILEKEIEEKKNNKTKIRQLKTTQDLEMEKIQDQKKSLTGMRQIQQTMNNFKSLGNKRLHMTIDYSSIKQKYISEKYKPNGLFDFKEFLQNIEERKIDFNFIQDIYMQQLIQATNQQEKYKSLKEKLRCKCSELRNRLFELKEYMDDIPTIFNNMVKQQSKQLTEKKKKRIIGSVQNIYEMDRQIQKEQQFQQFKRENQKNMEKEKENTFKKIKKAEDDFQRYLQEIQEENHDLSWIFIGLKKIGQDLQPELLPKYIDSESHQYLEKNAELNIQFLEIQQNQKFSDTYGIQSETSSPIKFQKIKRQLSNKLQSNESTIQESQKQITEQFEQLGQQYPQQNLKKQFSIVPQQCIEEEEQQSLEINNNNKNILTNSSQKTGTNSMYTTFNSQKQQDSQTKSKSTSISTLLAERLKLTKTNLFINTSFTNQKAKDVKEIQKTEISQQIVDLKNKEIQRLLKIGYETNQPEDKFYEIVLALFGKIQAQKLLTEFKINIKKVQQKTEQIKNQKQQKELNLTKQLCYMQEYKTMNQQRKIQKQQQNEDISTQNQNSPTGKLVKQKKTMFNMAEDETPQKDRKQIRQENQDQKLNLVKGFQQKYTKFQSYLKIQDNQRTNSDRILDSLTKPSNLRFNTPNNNNSQFKIFDDNAKNNNNSIITSKNTYYNTTNTSQERQNNPAFKIKSVSNTMFTQNNQNNNNNLSQTQTDTFNKINQDHQQQGYKYKQIRSKQLKQFQSQDLQQKFKTEY